jgi:FAD/FMN-containing dehydrogenase
VTFARTLSGELVALDPTVIDAFASRLAGRVLVESAVEYEQARRVWNGLIDKRPAVIVRCSAVADVLDALRFARDHDLLVAVRGGGHNVAGFGTCDGGVVIDLSPLRGIRVDPAKRTVRAQAGVTWGDLDRETQVFGLAVPGGVVSTTGIAGLTLGGGQGWLRRTYGMTCDSLLSADVITVGGEFVTASDTERTDLFWALRGGGGNFGVVTDFEYRLHPVGPVVTYGAAMYPIEAAAAVLPAFRDYMDTAPDAVNASATLWTVPSTPVFPERLHGRSVIAVTGVYAGDGQRGEQILGAIRAFGDPILDVLELLVTGERSHPMFFLITAELERCLEGESQVMVPQAGHTMHRENTAFYNRAVAAFLQRHWSGWRRQPTSPFVEGSANVLRSALSPDADRLERRSGMSDSNQSPRSISARQRLRALGSIESAGALACRRRPLHDFCGAGRSSGIHAHCSQAVLSPATYGRVVSIRNCARAPRPIRPRHEEPGTRCRPEFAQK